MRFPRLKPTIDLVNADDGSLYLYRGLGDDLAIRDCPDWLDRLLGVLDGSRERATVVRDVMSAAPRAARECEIEAALDQLAAAGVLEDALGDEQLTEADRDRYDRQLRYFGDLAPPGQARSDYQVRLRDARVALLGLGALGGSSALMLAAAGIGRIDACDGDVVEESNLNRQVLYTTADVGTAKAQAAAGRIAALNPTIEFTARERWLDEPADVARAVEGADFVIDAVDRPAHEIERWVDAACFEAGVPYIGMSQSPPFVRVGPMFVPGETACYLCQERSWRERYGLFDTIANGRRPSSPASAIGPAAGVVGALVSMEVIHHLTGLAVPATRGAAVILDLRSLTTTRKPIARDGRCTRCA